MPIFEAGGRASHFASFAAACGDGEQARVLEVVEPEVERVGAGRVGELVHERLVGEGVLDAVRRAQRRGQERVLARCA